MKEIEKNTRIRIYSLKKQIKSLEDDIVTKKEVLNDLKKRLSRNQEMISDLNSKANKK